MIRIITRGRLKRYRTTCPSCGTVFTYEEVDIETSTILWRSFVECPLCRKSVVVSGKEEIEEDDAPVLVFVSADHFLGGSILVFRRLGLNYAIEKCLVADVTHGPVCVKCGFHIFFLMSIRL